MSKSVRPPLDATRCLRAALALIAAAWVGVCVAASSTDEFLDPDVAFKATARVLDARSLEVSFDIAPGYYLYREQFKFNADGGTLGVPQIPPGTVKFDETFGKNVETHRDLLRIALPVQQAGPNFRLAGR